MTSTDDLRRKLLRKAFRMPSAQTMRSRKSSVTNAFASTVLPIIKPTEHEIEEALAILGMNPENVRCAYCGDRATEWDHLRPLVINRRPTGYISEIANLVPSCNKCNGSKRNAQWREWMLSEQAPLSPTRRGIAGTRDRITRLEAFAQWRTPTCIDFVSIIGKDEWERYWQSCDAVVSEMSKCQEVAVVIRKRVDETLRLPRKEELPSHG
jgi:hypothetical protein